MKVAVVGAGIFGVTCAITFAKNGCEVDLFEKESDIFTHATGINQFRLHRGYHYPRSLETISSCFHGERDFQQKYGEAVLDDGIEHYYCIASHESKVCPEYFKIILDSYNLEYQEGYPLILNKDKVAYSVRVNEYLYDPHILKALCIGYLVKFKVNLLLNQKVSKEELLSKNYNIIIVATYSDNNSWVPELRQRDYQYEVCEKLILKLPEQYRNKSVVILDGAFMCIDPFGRTGYHAMGNVVHAVHQTTVGKKPEIDEKYHQILNKGIISDPPFSNRDKFLESAEEYFPGIKDCAKYIGSMFTIRTVLPHRDHDDARPTIIERYNDKIITVFSGKIPTCISAAREVYRIVLNKDVK